MDAANVVVIGYGYAGRAFHRYLIQLADGLHFYGVASSRTEVREAIDSEGLKSYADLDEVLDDDGVDVVVLATPNDTHAPLAVQAMDAGKHVVVDKPMALTVAESDAMIETGRRNGVLLSVFQNRRWDGDFLTIGRLLNDGRLGELLFAETAWHQCKPPRTWRTERARGGGKFFDLASHMIDQALLLIPHPVETVFARFQHGMWNTEVEDHAHCVLHFSNGLDFHIDTSSVSRYPKPRWYLLGSEGTLRKEGLDPQEAAMNAGDIDTAREDPDSWTRIYTGNTGDIREETVETASGRWRSYYENIAAALRGEAELAVTAESVRRVMVVIEAALESSESGKPVTIQDRVPS